MEGMNNVDQALEELSILTKDLTSEATKIKNGSILIVDDEILVRKELEGAFTDAGFTVSVAKDGFEAVGWLKKREFSYVLMDIKMPYVDGISILKKMKEDGIKSKVFLMTAYSQYDKRIKEDATVGLLMNELIHKPFKSEDVITLIRRSQNNGRKK